MMHPVQVNVMGTLFDYKQVLISAFSSHSLPFSHHFVALSRNCVWYIKEFDVSYVRRRNMEVNATTSKLFITVSDMAMVNIYSKYVDDKNMTDLLTSSLHTVCKSHLVGLSEIAVKSINSDHKHDIDLVLNYLQESEKRQATTLFDTQKETTDTIKDHIDLSQKRTRDSATNAHSLANLEADSRFSGLKDHISLQNTTLINTIDANMRGRLDFTRLSHDLSKVIKSSMHEEKTYNEEAMVLKIKDFMLAFIMLPNTQANQRTFEKLDDIKESWRSSDQTAKDTLNETLKQLNLDSAADSHRMHTEMESVHRSVKQFIEENDKAKDLSVQISDVSTLVKKTIDASLAGIDIQSQILSAAVTNLQQHVIKIDNDNAAQHARMVALQSGSENVMNKVNNISTQITVSRTDIRAIGNLGEQTMFERLDDYFTEREGFEVVKTHMIPHSCDLMIKTKGKNNISIEIKSHGSMTKKSVDRGEVNKFLSDLKHMNNSGVFISVHSGISGQPNFKIHNLEDGRFAFFLAENGYDTIVVKEVVLLIHHLEGITRRQASDGTDGTKLSPEALSRITDHINNECHKLEGVKKHIKQTLVMLTEISFKAILSIIQASQSTQHNDTSLEDANRLQQEQEVVGVVSVGATPTDTGVVKSCFSCTQCNKTYMQYGSLTRHVDKMHNTQGTKNHVSSQNESHDCAVRN